MSRLPCHVEAALRVRVKRGHQGVWDAIRDRRGEAWTLREIWLATATYSVEAVRDYVHRLALAGYVDRVGAATFTGAQAIPWRLIRDAGPEAPRLRRDGSEVPPTAQEAMWRTLRMIGRDGVTADDLVVMASTETTAVARTSANRYLQALARAGYLRVLEEGKPGHGKQGAALARYALRAGRNSGPAAPMIARITHAVWDPNLNQWAEGAEADVSGAGGGHG